MKLHQTVQPPDNTAELSPSPPHPEVIVCGLELNENRY